MARLKEISVAARNDQDQFIAQSSPSSLKAPTQRPSPTSTTRQAGKERPRSSSDKENDLPRRDAVDEQVDQTLRMPTRSSAAAGTVGREASTPAPNSTRSSRKRKMSGSQGQSQSQPSQARHRRELNRLGFKEFYDPDQDEEERRTLRRSMRQLNKELNDTRSDLLKADSNGLVTIIHRADEYFKDVKQTSDATIDSRTLVQAADLSYKRTNELTLGDAAVGIDVDEFVSKCLAFMRQGNTSIGSQTGSGGGRSTTQPQRRARHYDYDQEEEGDEQFNWANLGRRACFPHNTRPCVSGFLLGPLSVQKKVRQLTQRRAREARANPANAVRPQELVEEDLEKQETANLTVICKDIVRLLGRIQSEGWEACVKEQEEREDMTEEQAREMMLSHGISDDGCVPLFDFCVNPRSFGQTVENFFYVSFLIKEGSVGINFDSRDLPTLGLCGTDSTEERTGAAGSSRNQAVFALDFDTWEAIIESHGISKSLIPHRDEEIYEDGVLGNEGWYG